MTFLRRHAQGCHWLATALLAAMLAVRMLVPTGYMPGMADGAFIMQPCDGQSMESAAAHEAMMAGDQAHAAHGKDHNDSGKHRNAQAPCAFSVLAAPSLASADPIVLAIAIAFIIAALFRAEPPIVLKRGNWLRPPQQGPPLTA